MAVSQTSPSPKSDVAELLEALPETATWDEIEYAFYVRRKVREGQAAVDAGRYVTQEEVVKRLGTWLK